MTDQQHSSQEEKFLGIKATIGQDDDDGDIEIEQVGQEEPVAKPASKLKAEAKPEAKDDDDDDELESYSEKVQKRIKKMTWEKNEERRQREAAEQMREEAVRFAQQLAQRNQQYEQVINNGEGYLIQQIKGRAEAMLTQAKEHYRKAYEEGDTEAILAAQDAMLNAKAELFSATQHEQGYRQRVANWQQAQKQPQQQLRQQPVAPRPTARAQEWAQENPWFGKQKDMTALAYGIHERLVREDGYQPDSDEYFEEIDRQIRQRFPDYFDEAQGQVAPASTHRKQSVVAPAGRNNGAKPRKVKLTQTQLALARKLGLSPEQYARELTKDMYNG